MHNWQEKLDVFLANFKHKDDVVGVLVCGSYVTGGLNSHSDLDVHIILRDSVDYRERGNKIIDGLLIEYFANPPRQIVQYFDEDTADKTLMSQVQFATGKIISDKTGNVARLKEKAVAMVSDFYDKSTVPPSVSALTKYHLWDSLDNLQAAYESSRLDFDLLYFTSLDRLINDYMKAIGRPYTTMAIWGNIVDENIREKYLLRKLPDDAVSELIEKAIIACDRQEKIALYEQLTNAILHKFGGFEIDGFEFKSAAVKNESHKMRKYVLATTLVLFLMICAAIVLPSQTQQPPERIPVLTYHSIMPLVYYHPINVDNPWVLLEDTFYQQMRYLYENNFTTLTTCQLKDFLFNDGELPQNPVIITFDDGYLDNALFAAPIMRQFGFIGMQFIITEHIAETTQTMVAYPSKFMSEVEIFATLDVFEFGSHAHAMHRVVDGTPLLVSESVEDIKADILQSFEHPLTFTTGFAYPYGRYSRNALLALEQAGVLFAFTTHEDYLTRDTPPLLLPRFSVFGGPEGTTLEDFSNIVGGRR